MLESETALLLEPLPSALLTAEQFGQHVTVSLLAVLSEGCSRAQGGIK